MYNAVVRTTIAVVGRVFVQGTRIHFDDRLEALFQTERNVRSERIIKLFKLDYRNESGRSRLHIEAEHRFLIAAADLGCSFSRLCSF